MKKSIMIELLLLSVILAGCSYNVSKTKGIDINVITTNATAVAKADENGQPDVFNTIDFYVPNRPDEALLFNEYSQFIELLDEYNLVIFDEMIKQRYDEKYFDENILILFIHVNKTGYSYEYLLKQEEFDLSLSVTIKYKGKINEDDEDFYRCRLHWITAKKSDIKEVEKCTCVIKYIKRYI